MVRIPYIKIPSVRVGSIVPTSNIGTGGATPAPPTPIAYLTQWQIVGNSEVHGQEIWSCGEYNATDGKYHILVQPQGGHIADIALTEPLRKVDAVADTIEFPSNVEGKALVTRALISIDLGSLSYQWKTLSASYTSYMLMNNTDFGINTPSNNDKTVDIVCPIYTSRSYKKLFTGAETGIGLTMEGQIRLRDSNYDYADGKEAFIAHLQGIEALFILATPTTELVDAPQIEEADSYTCVISQGAKAVEWSSFTTNSE